MMSSQIESTRKYRLLILLVIVAFTSLGISIACIAYDFHDQDYEGFTVTSNGVIEANGFRELSNIGKYESDNNISLTAGTLKGSKITDNFLVIEKGIVKTGSTIIDHTNIKTHSVKANDLDINTMTVNTQLKYPIGTTHTGMVMTCLDDNGTVGWIDNANGGNVSVSPGSIMVHNGIALFKNTKGTLLSHAEGLNALSGPPRIQRNAELIGINSISSDGFTIGIDDKNNTYNISQLIGASKSEEKHTICKFNGLEERHKTSASPMVCRLSSDYKNESYGGMVLQVDSDVTPHKILSTPLSSQVVNNTYTPNKFPSMTCIPANTLYNVGDSIVYEAFGIISPRGSNNTHGLTFYFITNVSSLYTEPIICSDVYTQHDTKTFDWHLKLRLTLVDEVTKSDNVRSFVSFHVDKHDGTNNMNIFNNLHEFTDLNTADSDINVGVMFIGNNMPKSTIVQLFSTCSVIFNPK